MQNTVDVNARTGALVSEEGGVENGHRRPHYIAAPRNQPPGPADA